VLLRLLKCQEGSMVQTAWLKKKTLTIHPIEASFITNKVKLWSSLLTSSLKETACRLVGHDGANVLVREERERGAPWKKVVCFLN
jgi:hypothetical protein